MGNRFVYNTTYLLNSRCVNSFTLNKLLRVMSLVVIVVYIIIGSLLIFTNFFTVVPEQYQTLIGIVVMLYGFFRSVRYLGSKTDRDS
jgi:hypothetical protein